MKYLLIVLITFNLHANRINSSLPKVSKDVNGNVQCYIAKSLALFKQHIDRFAHFHKSDRWPLHSPIMYHSDKYFVTRVDGNYYIWLKGAFMKALKHKRTVADLKNYKRTIEALKKQRQYPKIITINGCKFYKKSPTTKMIHQKECNNTHD